jgi:hypothetical protein
MLSTQRNAVRDMIIDAYQTRKASGTVDPKLDAQYDRVMSGDFTGLVGAESQTAKAGPDITGIKVSGSGTTVTETAWSYARPGKGGNGTYSPTTMQPKRTGNGATVKMVNYIHVLLGQRVHNYGPSHPIHAALSDGISFDMAKKTIEFLKAQPYKLPSQRGESAPHWAPEQNYQIPGSNSLGESHDEAACAEAHGDCACIPSAPVQPAAPKRNAWQEWNELATPLLPFERFAVTGKDGATKFYRVFEYTRKSDGRKFIICRVVSGAAEDGHWADRLAPEIMISIAKQIHADGIKESAIRYGHETGRCCDCNRLLTDPTSKANGIGPICAAKPQWS